MMQTTYSLAHEGRSFATGFLLALSLVLAPGCDMPYDVPVEARSGGPPGHGASQRFSSDFYPALQAVGSNRRLLSSRGNKKPAQLAPKRVLGPL